MSNHDTTYKLRKIDAVALDQESTVAPIRLADVVTDDGQLKQKPRYEELPPIPPKRIDLSLGDARASALAANLDLAVELVNPAIARQTVSEELARFESTFNGSVTRNRIDPPPGFAAGGEPDTTFDSITGAIKKPLTTGGEINITHDVQKADLHSSMVPNTVDTDLGIELRQPILRGRGYRVNTAVVQVARTQSGIADAGSKLTAIRVLADVERAYWRLYAAQQQQKIAKQQLELAEKQLDAAKKLVEAEAFTKVEVWRAESGVLARQDLLITAETNVRLAQRELKRIMQRPDLPVASHTAITVVTPPNPLGLTFDRETLAARALDNRMEMLQLQLQYLIDSLDIEVERNSVLPRVDLVADLSALGLDSIYRRSANNLFESEFGDRLVGITMDIPLSGNVGARARLRQARLRRMQTRIEQERIGVLIVKQVNDAIDQVEQNWQRIIATRRTTIVAQRAFEGESRLHQASRRTSTDVFIALRNLGEAQAQEIRAITDYQIAKVDLALAAGAMLGYGQIDWNPCRGAISPPPTPRMRTTSTEPGAGQPYQPILDMNSQIRRLPPTQ